ncbi:hypothetical protein T11_2305 [Trichinella zimbabwensis]|uniref:Uncharacterized protein n=1 Tax=Trichinella zimbabwensis TaxID=268475 RepID=A0A0V1GL49_9BILA|nr:hypothetical protein T11_2305 [Trichinella zimbabwensis]
MPVRERHNEFQNFEKSREWESMFKPKLRKLATMLWSMERNPRRHITVHENQLKLSI